MSDVVQFTLQAQFVERPQRQGGEDADALIEQAVGFFECEGDLGGSACRLRRISNAPVRRHRLAGPDRARLRRCAVADGEHEIELRFTGFFKYIPRFRAIGRRIIAKALQ